MPSCGDHTRPVGAEKGARPIRRPAKALLAGRDEREWCDVGVGGIIPKVGKIPHGTEVELLDDAECRDMAHVRVVTGDMKGQAGCMVQRALSTKKPE